MIPKIIHYCWLGGKPLPKLALKCIASWKKFCPDYEIREWNESNFNFGSVPYMKEAYEEKVWGFVPDVARLQIVFEHGGIYLDTDVEVIKPLDNLLINEAFMGRESSKYVALGLGFGAVVHHPLLGELLNDYMTLHFRNPDGSLNKRPSPQIQTETLLRYGLIQQNVVQTLKGAVIYPTDFFCPMDYRTGVCNITEKTYSIHHYAASWFDKWDRLNYFAIPRYCVRILGERLGLKVGRILSFPSRVAHKFYTLGGKETMKLIAKRLKLFL